MTLKELWKISLVTTPEGEEMVRQAFQDILGQPASSFTQFSRGRTTVSSFQEQPPDHWSERRRKLAVWLARMKDLGFDLGSGRLKVTKIRRENWADSWKKHFKPIDILGRLLIKPSWSRRRAGKGQSVIRLDPGLSFGTGHHPTTAFCLSELVRRREAGAAQSFLDIGTGSGILVLAAARLGYHPVLGIDSDAEAVQIARENARKNRLHDRTRFLAQDLTRMPAKGRERYDLVCANLTSSLLVSERAAVSRLLKKRGVLVLAGILRTEFETIRRAYEAAGLNMIASQAAKEWRSASFKQSAR